MYGTNSQKCKNLFHFSKSAIKYKYIIYTSFYTMQGNVLLSYFYYLQMYFNVVKLYLLEGS